jgi:hypothetical protein
MRQKSTTLAQLAGERDLCIHRRPAAQLVHDATPGARDASTRRAARHAAARADCRQARRDPARAAAGALTTPPAPRTSSCHAQLLRCGIARSK